MRIQVVSASRHGGTAGIAERIAATLRADGVDVVLADAATRPDPRGFDAVVVGSGVYMGSWLKEGIEYLERHQAALATKPVWLFSSGPLPGSSKQVEGTDPLTNALGPTEGPGSGGHKQIAALENAIRPRAHRVFEGAYDPSDPPKSLPERVVRMMPGSWKVLPVGDFRDWAAIEAWAHEISADVGAAVPIA
jgi:menaquinone-dependent protoporphyrinogen oxidase